jgi:hypothetical protein
MVVKIILIAKMAEVDIIMQRLTHEFGKLKPSLSNSSRKMHDYESNPQREKPHQCRHK